MKQAVGLLAGTPTGEPSEVLEPCDGKLSRAVLRRERGRKAPDLSGAKNNKMDQLLTGLLLTLVGAYIAYLLTKSYNRRLRKREVVSELAESLRHTLHPIQR